MKKKKLQSNEEMLTWEFLQFILLHALNVSF